MTTPGTHEPTTSSGTGPRRTSDTVKAGTNGARDASSEPAGRLRAGASAAADAIPEAMTRLRGTIDTVAERLPDAVASARVTALETADSIREMPEPTRRSLAALSIGLGIGLSLAGAPRLLTMAALAPALLAALVMAEDRPRSRSAAPV
jgi:hypothetical protein